MGRVVPPPVVKFPVPRSLGDILQSWAHRCPQKLRALEKLVIYLDSLETEEIAKVIRAMGHTQQRP